MSDLQLRHLTRRFSASAGVFDLSLAIPSGRALALLGPSGSGKTTTLRLLGGFESPDGGNILVDGEDVVALRPEQRRFGMVFQHYALFPHLDAGENVAFGLESRGVRSAELHRRVAEALALVDLAGFERRRVAELSGGQQQRVALARALAPSPRVILLDEPLSNLDPALRERTRRELRALIRRIGLTTIIVTHEQEDAFDLGDMVAVLREGRLEQVGTPEELYQAPATPFVGGFIGRGSWMEGKCLGGGRLRLAGAQWAVPDAARLGAEVPVRVLIRPETLRFARPGEDGIAGTVTDRRFAGAQAHFTVTLPGGTALEVASGPQAAVVGEEVRLRLLEGGEGLVRCFPVESA
ncbi:MAG: ABC transporter ATP-binding protein [Gemmatimonadota bacterium]|nr:ABC transporter ATP-binding protein [Gemmatimonadota bacterium]MDH4348187.1 ABC transporter ATP-binding protein [Gemmatimonadota bacterium]MDH5282664.1 ABC transporter ATP-binding protein [Gemmatimonadota bacterium]